MNDVDKSCRQLDLKVNKKCNLIIFGVGISVSTFR